MKRHITLHRVCIALLVMMGLSIFTAVCWGTYAIGTYTTPFQIQQTNGTTQTVAIGSGCTLGADSGGTCDFSAAVVKLPAFVGGSFQGSNGTGNCTLNGAQVGQRVLAVFDISGSAVNSFSTTASNYFATSIATTGSLAQTATNNLSTHSYGVILTQPGYWFAQIITTGWFT